MKKISCTISNLKIKKEKSSLSGLRFLLVLIMSLLLLSVNMMAQDFDLSSAKVEVVVKGKNTLPVEGDGFKLKSYRLEVLQFPQSSEFALADKNQPIRQAVRFVITGEFPSSTYVLWINGVGNLLWKQSEDELNLVFHGNDKKFEEGSEIAISRYGLKEPRVYLPEPFIVPSDLQIPRRSKDELRRNITLGYVDCDGSRLEKVYADCVLIGVYKDPYREVGQSLNQSRYLQIGSKEFATSVISVKEFEQLKDGEWIVVKADRGVSGGAMVGILDKSSLGKK